MSREHLIEFCAVSAMIDILPPSVDDDDMTLFLRRLVRECGRCQVIVAYEMVFDDLVVPLAGTRVALKPGRSYVLIKVTQGPVGGVGARPLPAAVMASAEWPNGPCQWRGAQRMSFGGIELEATVPDWEVFFAVMRRLYWALVRDGDLRNFDLPNPRAGRLLARAAGGLLPWRGYDLRAA